MKYLVILLIFVSCEEKQPSKLEQAKLYADTVFYYVDKGMSNELSIEESKKMANPYQAKMDSLRAIISKSEQDSLDAHRERLVLSIADSMVARGKR